MSFMRHATISPCSSWARSYSDMALSRRVMAGTAIDRFWHGRYAGDRATTDGFGRELDTWEPEQERA